MKLHLIAACAAALSLTPASAAITTVKFQGSLDHQIEPGIDPVAALGDVLTITFSFDPVTQSRDEVDPSYFRFDHDTAADVFSVTTSRGLLWTAADEITDNGVLLKLDGAASVMLGAHYNRADSATVPDLIVGDDLSFRIQAGDYLYGNTSPSLGFSGKLAFIEPAPDSTSLAAITAVAEPEDWALMILGFLLAGVAIRWRRSTRPVVAGFALKG